MTFVLPLYYFCITFVLPCINYCSLVILGSAFVMLWFDLCFTFVVLLYLFAILLPEWNGFSRRQTLTRNLLVDDLKGRLIAAGFGDKQ